MAIGSDGYYIGGDGTQHTEIPGVTPTPAAIQAGIDNAGIKQLPFNSMLNADGTVKSNLAVDPTKSDAFNQMAAQATATGPSTWAQMQLQQNATTGAQNLDKSNAQALGAADQASQSMMTQGGGMNSGASALNAMNAARNQTMAAQNVNANTANNAATIGSTDAQNKQTLLGQVANTETAAQSANSTIAQQDTTNLNLYNTNKYNQEMAAYGAAQTANGQRAAASGGKK